MHCEWRIGIENEISAGAKERREREIARKRPDLGDLEREGEKSVRTVMHVRHFPDLPFGEITIEGTSFVKHCTTQQQRKVQG